MEYLDLLNNRGELTGEKVSRAEAHAKGLWHNTVHVIFFQRKNDNINILIHLRSKNKDSSPDKWDFRFGGHVRARDTIEKTVVSEIKEEVGMDIKISDLLAGERQPWPGTTNNEFVTVYFYEFNGALSDLRFDDGEVQEVKWMSVDEILGSLKSSPEIWVNIKPEGFKRIVSLID